MHYFEFDVTFCNISTIEVETIRRGYSCSEWDEALDRVTEYVKEELKRRYEEIGKYDWYLDTIKSYLA